MNIPYRVETERLIIRPWKPEDALALNEATDSSLGELRPWMPWAAGLPQTPGDTCQLLRQFRADFDLDRNYVFGILEKDDVTAVGGTGLHPRVESSAREIGYWIRTDRTGRGYATEAAAAMIRVGFELLGLKRLEIRCNPENRASGAVARKLGFTHEATLPRRLDEPTPGDVMIWSLFAEDYPDSPAAGRPMKTTDALGVSRALSA